MTFARELHAKYSAMEGSAQIALIYSLEQLDVLLKLYRPTHILELGGGIGTISELLLLKSDAKIEVVENNDFCIEKMVKNLSHLREYKLIDDYKFLSSGSQADMLIVDVNNGIFNISKLICLMPNLKVIFIEGHHLAHRLNISRALKQKGAIQEFRDLRPRRGQKGCGVFYTRSSTSGQSVAVYLSFLKVYKGFILSFYLVKVRSLIGNALNKISFIPLIKNLRKLYLHKIPWNF
jgi:hypothetical protein